MRWALVALALGAATAGFLGISATSGLLPKFLGPVVGQTKEALSGPSELVLSVISVAVGLAGILLAWFVYLSGRIDWMALRARFGGAKRALQRGLYVDDFYGGALVGPAKLGSAFAAYVVDRRVIDGAANGVGVVVAGAARAGRRVQTGLVRNYALGVLLGVAALLAYVAVRF
jgi:NADH-quinone oxidoreductase subunit L